MNFGRFTDFQRCVIWKEILGLGYGFCYSPTGFFVK